MPAKRKPSTGAPKPLPGQPSPRVIKLQIAGAVFVPMLLLGIWLHRQGFW
jgi:hypothetical protein